MDDKTQTITIETEYYRVELQLKGTPLSWPDLNELDEAVVNLLRGAGYHPRRDNEDDC